MDSETTAGTAPRATRASALQTPAHMPGARAMWKGCIEFGSVSVPIKLYSAVQEKGVHFRLLDRRTKKPVKQHMIRPDTGDVVEQAETKRAVEVDRRSLVILDEEDIE